MTFGTFNGTGADCSGTSGARNRVLTLSNTGLTIQSGLLVYASGLALGLTTEYTVTHNSTNSTITFLNGMWDDMTIVVRYQQQLPFTAATDFELGPLVDFGILVTRTSVTETFSNVGGQKTYTDGSTSEITVVFANPNQKYSLDKSGLTEGADAVMYTKAAETINKYDKILFNSKNYRVDTVSERKYNGSVAYKKVTLFLI